MTEQQLFANYELDNSKWQTIIYKFLGGSLVLHIVFLLSAVYVPVVRDAFYVAMLFSDTDLRTVNKDYTLEEVGDNVTMINLADPNRFRYPEGYFNTGEYVDPMDPTIMAVNGDPTLSGAPIAPPVFDPAPLATPTPFPTPAASVSGIPPMVNLPPAPRNRKRRSELPPLPPTKQGAKVESLTAQTDGNDAPKKPNENQNANTQPKPSPNADANALLKEEDINKKPLIDFGVKVDQLQKDKKIDLNQPFAITIEGELEKGGKLSNPNVTNKQGDQQLVELTKELVAVLNASGVLKTLSDVALKDSPSPKHKIKFDVNNDDKNLAVNITFELANADVAYKLQSGINALIALNKMQRKDKVEGQILQNVRAESDGNQIVFKTLMPRQDAQKLIQDQLAAAVKEKQDTTKQ